MQMHTLILGENYTNKIEEYSKITEILFSTKDKTIVGINVKGTRKSPLTFIPFQPDLKNKKINQKGTIHFSSKTIIHSENIIKTQSASLIQKMMLHIPLIGQIYLDSRKLFESFFRSKEKEFKFAGMLIDTNTLKPNYFLIRNRRKILSIHHTQLANISSGAPTLDTNINFNKVPVYLSDQLATKEANYALKKFFESNYSSISNVKIKVTSGTAVINGVCQFQDQKLSIENFLKDMDGVISIENNIVCDIELEIQIAKKIAEAGIYQYGIVSIKSYQNKISLTGNLSSRKHIDSILSIIYKIQPEKIIDNKISIIT